MSKKPLLGCLLVLALGACASAPVKPAVTPRLVVVPARVTAQNFAETQRHFNSARPNTKEFEQLRAGLLEYLTEESQQVLAAGNYDDVLQHVSKVTALYSPEEIAEGHVPAMLEPLCRFILDEGEKRADEGSVLGALLLLHKLDPDSDAYESYYTRLKEWGISAREILPDPMGLEDELIRVWTRHAQIAPTPEVLSALARRHIEERARFVRRFQMAEGRFTLSAREFEHIQNKSFDIAGVFLRFGDVASSLSHLKAAGAAGSLDARLIEQLEQSREEGQEGADALLGLAAAPAYRLGDPDVSQGICELGTRAYPVDPRFLVCLGNLAATKEDVEGAVAFYSHAIELAPDDRGLRDAYLYDLYGLLTESAFEVKPTHVQAIADHLIATLSDRLSRWPDAAPPVPPSKLYLAVALAHMNAGQAAEAEARLRDSLRFEETMTAYYQLGNLLSRLGRTAEAAVEYQAAIRLVGDDDDLAVLDEKAELFERMGDAQRMAGKNAEALLAYKEGLALWDSMLPRLRGVQAGFAQVRRGVLLNRLQQHEEARKAFELALQDAPGMAETYKGILAHLVMMEPDQELALEVFRHAQNQLRLEPEWKVYLALWMQIVAGRGKVQVPEEALHTLEDYAGDSTWWAQLSAFGAGKLSYEELLQSASDPGQRAETAFYGGARQLLAGDVQAARALFEQVLVTRMVNFYEYLMAQELLALLPAATP